MTPLSKIRAAGFSVTLAGDGFEIAPANSLTMQQREFLKSHKTEIITELQESVEWQELPEPAPGALLVTCYSPSGFVCEVEVTDHEHAAILKHMNPMRLEYVE